MRLLSNLLFVFSILLLSIGIFFVYQRYNPMKLAFADMPDTHSVSSSSVSPARILIPSIGVDLPIFGSKIEDNKWSDTKAGVSYLVSSPLPGDGGNSILYGHNWSGLLGRLPRITPGDTIHIIFSDGSKKSFEVAYTAIVDPSQTGVLASSDKPILTIYTCIGFLDSKRFVASAFLSENN